MRKHALSLAAKRPDKPSVAREKLLQAVRLLLSTHQPAELTTSLILKQAGVARNTLYLHFEDLANLLETVLVSMFSESVEKNIRATRQLVQTSRTKAEFKHNLLLLIKQSQGKDRQSARFARCRLVAYSESNPRLAKLFGIEQAKLNDAFEQIFKELKKTGWLRKQIDPQVASVLIQSLTLGKVIDDISPKPMPQDSWNAMFAEVVLRTLIND